MSILDPIEKLINEHASAAVLKEHLAFAKDQCSDLERKLSEAQKEAGAFEALLGVEKQEHEKTRDELRLVNGKLKQIQDEAGISGQLVRQGNVYYRKHPDGSKTGPYCLACWDGERKLVNVEMYAYGVHKCGRCEPDKFKKA